MNWFALAIIGFAALAWPMAAKATLDVPAEVSPGGLIIGSVEPGSQVTVDGASVRVSQSGRFLAGVGRDDTGVLTIIADGPQGRDEQEVRILSREYNIQRIDGLPQNKVTPDPKTLERIGRESAAIRAVRTLDTEEMFFANATTAPFEWPAIGRISGVYGSQRILNGEPRRPHFGVDIAAPTGTPIITMAPGIVRLVHEDMFLTGKTVMVDHGHGLMSVYIHMNTITVEEGQRLARSEQIGTIGSTGRSTGPHLHWGVTLFAEQLDPALLVGPMPRE